MPANTRVIPVYEPTPMGIIAQVHIDVWTALTGAANEFGLTTFIELGVYRGGTGIFYVERCRLDPDFLYVGVDLHPEWIDPQFSRALMTVPNAHVLHGSVFNEQIKQHIAEILQARGVTMVFADHGGEVLAAGLREYAPLLKPGDYLVVHDYPDEIGDYDIAYILSQGYAWVDRARWMETLNTPLFRKL